ncbi:Serpentine Receptor, class Z [Caenorhabditis elegans]|uniref:Serpentine Receptor, class Z n=1 Tax=Caenorhabditis elegans TaxID=6239 RepID=O44460_CAEEL|nr:Serpentine Receptor, class Z [Caenorhabditis elegans]CCD64020.1 Serpentine Receptor, class Z [Caenorhabditis elegans]|eukprot:NP_500359.1 Serpentine Receptor, class Z [Caenorhabditis elegans]
MNFSKQFNDPEFIENVTKIATNGLVAIFYISTLLYLVIFPFYVYVFKLNRRRDRKTLLFPTVSHFYGMVKITYCMFGILIFCNIMILCNNPGRRFFFGFFVIVVAMCIVFTLYLCTAAFHFITFLLAAQRFLIFFFPNTEKHVAVFQKFLFKHIWKVYLVIFVKEVTLFIIFNHNTSDSRRTTNFGVYILTIFSLSYALLFLSTVFYIPIMISAWKVYPAQKCAVQKYIYWQTLTVFIFKSTAIVIFIYQSTFGAYSTVHYTSGILATDVVTTPLIVQISYLGSNRWTSKSSVPLKWKKFFRVLFDMNKSSVVKPQNVY